MRNILYKIPFKLDAIPVFIFVKIKFARLQNFRNVGFAEIGLDAASVWICGANAQGKTNLLEALGLLAAARSFRTSDISVLVKKGRNPRQCLSARKWKGREKRKSSSKYQKPEKFL